jgi:hypothetical protein
MKPFIKRTTPALVFISLLLLLLMAGSLSACDYSFPDTTTPAATPQPSTPEPATSGSVHINSAETAEQAVYQHLLGQAQSYDARIYLADFYSACDNWTAEKDYFHDGSGTWYVTVDMTAVKDWELRPYWQQASWYVYRDGRVVPSNDFQANALRIEADLQSTGPSAGQTD